jgi:hypothetical protein
MMEGLNSFLHYSGNIDFAVYHEWNIRICWELLVLDGNRIFPRMDRESCQPGKNGALGSDSPISGNLDIFNS